MRVSSYLHSFKLSKPFGISRGEKTHAEVLRVEISEGGYLGRGEGVPYARYGDSSDLALRQIASLPESFDRESLLDLLPPGSARNAVDAALWDLEANQTGKSIAAIAGMAALSPLPMGYTISLASKEAMIADAREHSEQELIKIKLGSEHDREALFGIRSAAPNARLIVDVNEGWNLSTLKMMLPVLEEVGVELLEQPMSAESDFQLGEITTAIPICADESNHPGRDIADLASNYSFVNVKLDKAGGLTAAIEQIERAREVGIGVMVGCMVSSSLGIAPAFIAAQLADYSDLDGFLTIEDDEQPRMLVSSGKLSLPTGLWA